MLQQISIPGSALRLSSMALGAGAFGGRLANDEIDRIYETFRAAGGTCFDTAHCYCFWLPAGAGCAEKLLGACIRRHGDEGKVAIIGKGGHPAVEPGYPRPDGYLSPEVLSGDIAESLQRLGCSTIDLYLLHRDDRRVPVGELIDSLNAHMAGGRIGAIGVSNWSTARISEANEWASRHQRAGFVVSQPEFSLAFSSTPAPTSDPAMRHLTAADIAWHTRTQMPATVYGPTAGGYFASNGQRGGAAFDNAASRGRLARAQTLARQLGVTPQRIALAYLMGQPFPVIPILGTSDVSHLVDSVAAADIELTADQCSTLAGDEPVAH